MNTLQYFFTCTLLLISAVSFGSTRTPASNIDASGLSDTIVSSKEIKEIKDSVGVIEWKAGVQINGILGGFDQRRGHGHDSKLRNGFGGGVSVVGQLAFLSHWIFRTSLNLDYIDYPIWLELTDGQSGTWMDCDYKSLSLSVPVMVGYRFSLTDWADLDLITGVATSWDVSNKLKLPRMSKNEVILGASDIFRRFNLQYTLGFSIEMFDRFMVSGIGYFGLRNLGKMDVFGYRWNSTSHFEFSIGYLLGNANSKWRKRNEF